MLLRLWRHRAKFLDDTSEKLATAATQLESSGKKLIESSEQVTPAILTRMAEDIHAVHGIIGKLSRWTDEADAANRASSRDLVVTLREWVELQKELIRDTRLAVDAGRDSSQALFSQARETEQIQRVLASSLDEVRAQLADMVHSGQALFSQVRETEESLALRQRQALADPSNADWQRDLSISRNKVGDVLRAQGDLAGALQAYRESLALGQRQALADPSNAVWQRDLSVSQEKVGDVLLDQGDLAGALQAYREAETILRRLASADPSNGAWQRDLSASQEKMGELLQAQGDLAGAHGVSPPGTSPLGSGGGGGGGDWGDRIRFSAFYPEKVGPDDVARVLAYGHLEKSAKDVASDAVRRMKLLPNVLLRASSEVSPRELPRTTVIKVTPDVPGLSFDVSEATMSLWEDAQSVEFRFRPTDAAAGKVCKGWVHFWLEGLILADVPVVIYVTQADCSVPRSFRELSVLRESWGLVLVTW